MPSHNHPNLCNAAPARAPREAHLEDRSEHAEVIVPKGSGRVVAWVKNPLVVPGRGTHSVLRAFWLQEEERKI